MGKLKTFAKNAASGKYGITHKLTRIGAAAQNIRDNALEDFNSDGPSFGNIGSAHESPFRMPNHDVLPAFQPHREHQSNHKTKRQKKRKPRKVVYY